MDFDLQGELEKFFSTAWEQITNQSTTPASGKAPLAHLSEEMYFTQQFHRSAEEFGLSQEDALDVYHYGEAREAGKSIREYQDCEVGITYFLDPKTGRIVITSIWKQQISL